MGKGNDEQEMKHPREDLSFTCNRRTLFRALFQEATVIRGSLKGKVGCRLSELGSLPDEQLAQVRPVVNPDYEISLEQGQVWASYKLREQAPLSLFSMQERESLISFNMFNGQHTVADIAHHLAMEIGWEEDRAFAHVRDLFLSLVKPMVCLPKEPIE
jgi:hypothetical protein